MPAGRPSDYNEDIAARICLALSEGQSLRAVCRQDWAPDLTTIWKWIGKHPEFVTQYTRAKQEGLEALAEDIMDIADNGTNDWMEKNDPDNPGWRVNGDHIKRAQLRIDSRKWVLSKLCPKKFGDKVTQEVSGIDGKPIEQALTVQFVKADGKS